MSDTEVRRRKHLLSAGLGGFIGAFALYLLVAGFGGGVDLEDRLTFDQSGELELEGILIGLAVYAAPAIALPIGVFVALRRRRAARAAATALVAAPLAFLITLVALRVAPSGIEDPVVAPFLVFGAWFVVPLLVRSLFERPPDEAQQRIDPRF